MTSLIDPHGSVLVEGVLGGAEAEVLEACESALPVPVVLARLPLAPRHARTRDALLHALVLRNFGVTHLVLDASRADLATADVLVRFQRELGLVFVHGAGRAAGATLSDTRAAA